MLPIYHRHHHADGVHHAEVNFKASHPVKGPDTNEQAQAGHEKIHTPHKRDSTVHATTTAAHDGS
jgi:hypothetical protein